MSFWKGFEKRAISLETGPAGVLGGVASGYYSGRSAAGTTANALSQYGSKTRNEESARNIAKVTGPMAAIGGIVLGYKHKDKLLRMARKHISNHPDMEQLYHGILPFGAGTLGGMAGGAATGAAMSLRGHREKFAFDVSRGLRRLAARRAGRDYDEADKIATDKQLYEKIVSPAKHIIKDDNDPQNPDSDEARTRHRGEETACPIMSAWE